MRMEECPAILANRRRSVRAISRAQGRAGGQLFHAARLLAGRGAHWGKRREPAGSRGYPYHQGASHRRVAEVLPFVVQLGKWVSGADGRSAGLALVATEPYLDDHITLRSFGLSSLTGSRRARVKITSRVF